MYAKGFRIIQFAGYQVLELLDTTGNPNAHYKIVNSDSLRLVCLSTTHASMIAALGEESKIAGMAFASRTLDPVIKNAVNAGQIKDLGEGNESAFEQILAIRPDIYFVYPYGDVDYSRFEAAGIQCIPIAEYLETHPLGRAEWIKVFGAICGQSEQADIYFTDIKDAYNEVLEKASLTEIQPEVFTGSSYQGQWYAPSGESLIATFIKDAGARYSFAQHKGQSNIQLELEVLMEQAADADYWGEVIFEPADPDLNRLLQAEPRLNKFKAFQNEGDGVFYCNAALTDYFGIGVLRPDQVVADLFAIFHPELLPAHEPVYFKKLHQK
jgi:iron complex transport system substrate-binding protein